MLLESIYCIIEKKLFILISSLGLETLFQLTFHQNLISRDNQDHNRSPRNIDEVGNSPRHLTIYSTHKSQRTFRKFSSEY